VALLLPRNCLRWCEGRLISRKPSRIRSRKWAWLLDHQS
jgi:hypothetical protein